MTRCATLLALLPLTQALPTNSDDGVTFVTFDGTRKTTHHWNHMDVRCITLFTRVRVLNLP